MAYARAVSVDPEDTSGAAYTARLAAADARWWKRLLDVQAPYRRNLLRLRPGRTLDIGCGIGRNLAALEPASIGVDHNEHSVAVARGRDFTAFTPGEFAASPQSKTLFESLLFAHVLEHMTYDAAETLVATYLPYLEAGGTVIVITPQAAGFRSDPTHVVPFGFSEIDRTLRAVDLVPIREQSFPFPRTVGRWFRYNEHVVVARRKGEAGR